MKHKVLSVKQPWAYLLCSGIKDIENRTWKLPEEYKGQRVLIHASTNIRESTKDLLNEEQFDVILGLSDLNKEKYFNGRQVERAIIGSVEIVDCVLNHPSIWAKKTEFIFNSSPLPFHEEDDVMKPIYNWVLANPILFDEPILNVKGKLGFWDYDLSEEYETILKL